MPTSATNSGGTWWAPRGIKNIPSDPVAKVLWGMAGVGAWLTDLMHFFFFPSVSSLLFQTIEKTELWWVKDPKATPKHLRIIFFLPLPRNAPIRDCRSIQKCCECSYRHSSSRLRLPPKQSFQNPKLRAPQLRMFTFRDNFNRKEGASHS